MKQGTLFTFMMEVLLWLALLLLALFLLSEDVEAADYESGPMTASCTEKYCLVSREDLMQLVETNRSLSADLEAERASKMKRCAQVSVSLPSRVVACACADRTQLQCKLENPILKAEDTHK